MGVRSVSGRTAHMSECAVEVTVSDCQLIAGERKQRERRQPPLSPVHP